MNVLAWNLNNRVRDAPAQWACVRRYAADFVALSEVPKSQVPVWAGRLSEGGYDAVWTFGQQRSPRAVLLASRTRLPPPRLVVPGQAIAVDLPDIVVMAVHVPNGSKNRPRKLAAFDALLREPSRRAIVAGDFNSPRHETPDGTLIGFGSRTQRVVEERFFASYEDPFRQLHGYRRAEWSWRLKNRYRLDHILHRGLDPVFAAYHPHEGMSDHKLVEVRFADP